MTFLAQLFKALAPILIVLGSENDPAKLDQKAYKIVKSVITQYEESEDRRKETEAGCMSNGMLFDSKSGRSYCTMQVKFVKLSHGVSDGKNTPYAEFEFEALTGPFAGKTVSHRIYHTKGFSGTYRTEDTFVRKHLKYEGSYDAEKIDMMEFCEKGLNDEFPGKYIYSITYYPPENGKYTKVIFSDKDTVNA